MKKVIITTGHILASRPQTLVRSYIGGKEYTSLHVGVTPLQQGSSQLKGTDYEDKEPDTDGQPVAYICTLIEVVSDEKLAMKDVLHLLHEYDMWYRLTADLLAELAPLYDVEDYETLASYLVGARYTTAEELACHRKALLGDSTEFDTLNNFVEQCKNLARSVFRKK